MADKALNTKGDGSGKLGWGTRLGFMACSMPELIKSYAWDAFVLFFYSQVVGLDGYLIGLAIAVILVFDAIVDPYIGALSDRMDKAPLGRRHTLMVGAIIPFAVGISLVFSPPDGMGQWQVFGWLLATGLLARVGISFWTIPAFALGGELSRDSGERNIIAVVRNIANQMALLSVPAIAFAFFFVDAPGFSSPQLNPSPYPAFGMFIGLMGATLMVIGILGTRRRALEIQRLDEKLVSGAKIESVPQLLRRLVMAVRITPNVGRVLLVALMVLFMNSVVNQLTLHLATYFWQLDGDQTRRIMLAGTIGSIIAFFVAPFWIKLVGSRAAMVSGISCLFVLQASAVFLPLIGLAPAPASVAIGIYIFVLRIVGGFAYGLFVVPFNTVIYDVGDEHEANTGLPQQGLVASFMFVGVQVGSGLVALLAGSFLGFIDFPVGLSVEEMPQDKVRALAWFVTGLIVLAGTLVALVVGGFDVSAKKQEGIREKLALARDQTKL